MDKPTEQQRARSVNRQLLATLSELGFAKSDGGSCTIAVCELICRVGIQKFRNQPAFRIIYNLERVDGSRDGLPTEHSDRFTYHNNPSGRQFNFDIQWGDEPVVRCLTEIHDFVRDIVVPWAQSTAASEGG